MVNRIVAVIVLLINVGRSRIRLDRKYIRRTADGKESPYQGRKEVFFIFVKRNHGNATCHLYELIFASVALGKVCKMYLFLVRDVSVAPVDEA